MDHYQQELAPKLATLEVERLAALAEKQERLGRHRIAIAPERERLAVERQAQIEQTAGHLASVREELLSRMEAWEVEARQAPHWETLRPTELLSDFGEELELQADGSILATGALGRTGSNVILAPATLDGITGLRLEALPDDRLPLKGPGRAPDGNFVLNEIKLWLIAPRRGYLSIAGGII